MSENRVQSPEMVPNDYDGLPQSVRRVHEQWSKTALYMSGQFPALSNRTCEEIQGVATAAQELSVEQIRGIPDVAQAVLKKHKDTLAHKTINATAIMPADFVRGTFARGNIGDTAEYNFGMVVPPFEFFFDDICATAIDYPRIIDKDALRKEYDEIIEKATDAFASHVSGSFANRFLALDQLTPEVITKQVLPGIASQQNQFIETRLQRIAEAADVLSEQTRTQSVFRFIGRVTTAGKFFAGHARQREHLQSIIDKELKVRGQDFGTYPDVIVEAWLIEKEYVLDEFTEEEQLRDLYHYVAAQARQELEAIKQRYIPLEQPVAPQNILTLAQEQVLGDLAGRSFKTPADLIAALEASRTFTGSRKKRFRQFVRAAQLSPDISPDAELTTPFFVDLKAWYEEQEPPKNQR